MFGSVNDLYKLKICCLIRRMRNETDSIPDIFFDVLTPASRIHNYIEDITRWGEDMNFIFEWQNNILRTSAASE